MKMGSRAMRIVAMTTMGLGAAMLLASCGSEKTDVPAYDPRVYFGDGAEDGTMVVCRVGDQNITERQLNMRMEELNRDEKRRFAGPHGRRLLLKFMVDEYLLAHGANEAELYNDAAVARTLIMNRRRALVDAMRNIGLLQGQEPGIDEIRAYYEEHREELIRPGVMQARHVECMTRDDADAAYDRLVNGTG